MLPASMFQRFSFSAFQRFVSLLVLGYVWFRLIDHLRVEWSLNEQYTYGFAVPFLCAYLLYRRISASQCFSVSAFGLLPDPPSPLKWFQRFSVLGSQRLGWSAFQLFSFSAFLTLFLFTRWVEIANPDWRLVSWAMAIEVSGLTLLAIAALGGRTLLRQCAFPVLFFLVAIPWPTLLEHSVIQTLTRLIVAATIEFLHLTGTAALAHGNVIETVGGFVDVDEACSGIRSFQSALMLSLFFGEWHRFTAKRRLSLVGIALGLALLFNLLRTLVLSSVAANRGAPAIQQWHDPAGIIILVGCFTGIWLAATWLARNLDTSSTPPGSTGGSPVPFGDPSKASPVSAPRSPLPAPRSDFKALRLPLLERFSVSAFQPFSFWMVLLLAGELAIHFWYASAPRVQTASWIVHAPATSQFNATELPKGTRQILRYNESLNGTWNDAAENRWQLIYLRWNPGRVAVHLARNHTPEICLPAAGRKLQDISEAITLDVHGLKLSFRCFTTAGPARPMFVFYTLWEDGAPTQSAATDHLTWQRRLEAVMQRRRNPGQRVLQIALTGPATRVEAEQLLRSQLPRLISIQ